MPTEKTNYFKGLTQEQVTESRRKHGINILTPPPKESLWHQFLQKFNDPIIRILLIALLLSIAVSLYEYFSGIEGAQILLEPLGIFIAVSLATGIGFIVEVRANKAFEVLTKVNDDTPVKVIRDGKLQQVFKKDVVVGDIVLIDTGEEVPADGELVESVSMQVNESTLTGEPVCKKSIRPEDADAEATYPTNKVMRGTTVTDGHGIFRVEKVGDHTEQGKVYVAAQIDDTVKTPLNEQLDRLGKVISNISYLIGILIIIGRIFMYFDEGIPDFNWIDFLRYTFNSIMIAVTLIVVSVPEGLPMGVTLSLALSMHKMLKTNNLVRKMHACETMGATSVICTDKTGTLTQNQMRIYQTQFYGTTAAEPANSESELLVRECIAVNSTAHLDFTNPAKTVVLGNPTEGALLLWLQEQGISYAELRESAQVIEQLTFSTERKYMATYVQSHLLPGKKILYVKGASDILMPKCTTIATPTGLIPAEQQSSSVFEQLLAYQHQAMRTLGFAYKIIDDNHKPIQEGQVIDNDLIFMGIVAISDPVRPDVPQAVATCMDAGIRVIIVTGDTPGTAQEIARQIGIWSEEDKQTPGATLSGSEFAAMSDSEAMQILPNLKIMSRARPLDKERLVDLLQQSGQVVAVTGDGTNDAPALKKAQVGLSMGDGTSVAKEASDITIIDNSFTGIGRAVLWGRSLYKNIQRFILFQLTVNVAACLIVLSGAFMGTESPLTVTQMLWVNLIMDTFAALALASLPPTPAVMKDKPRKRKDFIISSHMAKNISFTGLLFFILLFGVLQYFKHYDITTISWDIFPGIISQMFNFSLVFHGLTPYELSLFFTIFVMLQFWNLFNVKSSFTGKSTFRQLFNSPAFTFIALVVFIGQILIVSFGGIMFGVTPISFHDWVAIIISTSLVLWIKELYILIFRR